MVLPLEIAEESGGARSDKAPEIERALDIKETFQLFWQGLERYCCCLSHKCV